MTLLSPLLSSPMGGYSSSSMLSQRSTAQLFHQNKTHRITLMPYSPEYARLTLRRNCNFHALTWKTRLSPWMSPEQPLSLGFAMGVWGKDPTSSYAVMFTIPPRWQWCSMAEISHLLLPTTQEDISGEGRADGVVGKLQLGDAQAAVRVQAGGVKPRQAV